jgi:hypothetical protein
MTYGTHADLSSESPIASEYHFYRFFDKIFTLGFLKHVHITIVDDDSGMIATGAVF